MAYIGEMQYLTIGDKTYSIAASSGGSTVSIVRNLTSGTKSATITVDGTDYDLYAPTVPTNISAFTNDSGYITSADVPEGASAYTGTISAVGTTASTGSNNGFARGDHVHNITKTTIDTTLGTGSGTTKFYREDGTWQVPAYTTNTDENVKSTAVTAATTNYIVGSTTSSTTTGGLSKHASAVLYTTADSGTSGYTQLRLGNTTATSSAGGKEGQIRLYGTNATYYVDLKAGAVSSSNKTITFPNKTGTVALIDDIPDVSSFITDAGVTKISTTAGAHTAITNSTGAVSFNVPTKTSHLTNDSGFITDAGVTKITTTAGTHTAISNSTGAVSFNVPTNTSHLTNDSGFITSYTDENMKWTASTSTNTYYPLQSTSTATTSTANTLNGISFYQYYNTAGGYRRLDLGNSTAYKSTGGAYGTIRLYGAAATYYGDLVPGVLGTTSGDGHISANRTWTLPDKTGTIALTSDIPDVSSFITDAGVTKITTTAGAHTAITNSTGAVSFNVPTKTSHLTNDSGFLTSYTDTNTTYTLSNALSSHKFTSTLTAGGSGSGTSTATMEFVAGTGITLTDDTTNKKITIALNYTETDPVFSASAAAGITSTDINNWNAKVSDTGKWNNVTLSTSTTSATSDYYLPALSSTSGATAYLYKVSKTPTSNIIAKYDDNAYLNSTTPSANDNSTKVATTAYVDAAIPTKVSDLTNDSGYITAQIVRW